MLYLLQRGGDCALESEIVKETIKKSYKYKLQMDSFQVVDIDEVGDYGKSSLPIGSLLFVSSWLKRHYNKDIKRIEIPDVLMKEEYLKRGYKKVLGAEIPKTGTYFIKGLEQIKDWSYSGDVQSIHNMIVADKVYLLSDYVNIKSEWRVYVISGKIENIVNYDGDALCFPDTKLIEKMVQEYSKVEDRPKSYTLDVMVTDKGTALLEIHPFVSVGLYSTLWSDNLLEAYKDGIDFCIKG